MTNKEMVAVTGIGVLSPIGVTVAEVAESLKSLRSGIRRIEVPPLQRAYPPASSVLKPNPSFRGSTRPILTAASNSLPWPAGMRWPMPAWNGSTPLARGRACITATSTAAVTEPRPTTGNYCATATGNQPLFHYRHHAQQRRGLPIDSPWHCRAGTYPRQRLRLFRSGNRGSGTGNSRWPYRYRAGRRRRGAIDAAILAGFEGMRALAPMDAADVAQSCKPFSSARSGLVLGEGAAFLVLESATHSRRRGARCLAWLQGYGIASDCHHMAVPHAPGQEAAMRQALADAGLEPSQLDYLNAHATGTKEGDLAKQCHPRGVWRRQCGSVPVSSTKALHGHLLGAASAMESVVALLAVTQGILPATAFLDQPDPACALNHSH